MKRWFWLLLSVASVAAAQATNTPRRWTQTTTCAAGTCTRTGLDGAAAPTFNAGAGPGLLLESIGAVDLLFCAPSTTTLSGAGTLTAWVWDNVFAIWARYPAGDLPVNVTAATARCMTFNDQVVGTRRGRWITWVPTGVTVSGASNGNVTLQVVGTRASL